MSTQVSKVASSCFYYIYNIRRIRKYLSREVCETLVNSLITSRLDYCNSLLYGCPSSLLARLQRVQNSATRLIYNVSRTFSSSPLLINLHWLPVKHRILFKILLITYKAIHSLAPDYIIQLIQVKSSNRTLRSSNAILLEHPTIKSSKTLGDRAFTLAAPVSFSKYSPSQSMQSFIRQSHFLKHSFHCSLGILKSPNCRQRHNCFSSELFFDF